MLLEHNVKVYADMCEALQSSNCVCVVMGTGVGKSYVALEYLEANKSKALIVSPRNAINKSWEKLCGNKVDTITYQKLKNIYKEIDFSQYDVVICDEVHHIGAATWSIPIRYILGLGNVKVIGLTESSVRYSDGGRDVAEEFFGGNVVFGESVPSAIEKKILNPVTYVGAMYNSDGLKKTLRGKIQSRLYAKLNLILNNTPTVTEILRKNMPSGNRKGIIFASTIDDIKFAMDFVRSVYPDADIRFVHSKQSDAYNEATMDWFKKTSSGYICSVDMISEGVHIKGVNTLIMLRRTESVNLFNQQLGRCLDANSKEEAILFDLVNNKSSVRIIRGKLRVNANSVFDSGKINIVPSSQLIVKDYTKDIVEVLKEIQDSLDSAWSEEDISLLREFYPSEGAKMRHRLSKEYTACAVICKASKLGIALASRKPMQLWSEEETAILRKYYPIYGGSSKMQELLPHRRSNVINEKAKALGMSNPNNHYLSMEEIEFIKQNHPIHGTKYCAKHLNVTKETIKNYVRKLGLTTHFKPWTEEECEILRKYYPSEGLEVCHRLPKHKPNSCKAKANSLGLRRDKK